MTFVRAEAKFKTPYNSNWCVLKSKPLISDFEIADKKTLILFH